MPEPIIIDSNIVLIVFKSDWSNEYQGFQLKYEVVCGGQFSEPSGIISSPYYPNSYPSSRTCIYEIVQSPEKGIVLTIVDMEIEPSIGGSCDYDALFIFDGDDDNSTLLDTLCRDAGSVPSQPYYSSLNYMYLKFVTDASFSNRGFMANYTTVDRS